MHTPCSTTACFSTPSTPRHQVRPAIRFGGFIAMGPPVPPSPDPRGSVRPRTPVAKVPLRWVFRQRLLSREDRPLGKPLKRRNAQVDNRRPLGGGRPSSTTPFFFLVFLASSTFSSSVCIRKDREQSVAQLPYDTRRYSVNAVTSGRSHHSLSKLLAPTENEVSLTSYTKLTTCRV